MSDISESTPNPPSPPALGAPPLPPIDPSATETGLSPNVAAGIAAIFPILGGIVFYFLEKKHPYIRFHALQSAYFGAAAFAGSIAVTFLTLALQIIPILGQILGVIIGLAWFCITLVLFVIWIISIIKAFSNKEWEIPWAGKLARKHLAKGLFFFVRSPAL